MRNSTALTLLSITAAGFLAAGIAGNAYSANPEPAPTSTTTILACTSTPQDEPCFTYEHNRLTNAYSVVTLQPGETLD